MQQYFNTKVKLPVKGNISNFKKTLFDKVMELQRHTVAFRVTQLRPAQRPQHLLLMAQSPYLRHLSIMAWCGTLPSDPWLRHRTAVLRSPLQGQCCQVQNTSEKNLERLLAGFLKPDQL